MVLVLFIVFVASVASLKTVPRIKCGVNEYAVRCKTICPPQFCNISYTEFTCQPFKKCIPGCDCIKDHLRNNENVCVFNENCPLPPFGSVEPSNIPESPLESPTEPCSSETNKHSSKNETAAPPLQCGVNEYAVPCKTLCPPQNCDIAYTSYLCDPEPKCIPGCDCIKDHLRNSDNICILNENCPGPLTLPDDTPNVIPRPPKEPSKSTQSSNKRSTQSASASSSSSSSSTSSSSESSVSSYASSLSCSLGTGGGEENYDCKYDKCTPTCSLPSPQNCPENSNPCNCPPGTIISGEGGECVQRQECQKYINCKGDYNATYSDCPIGCPSTCAKPNAEYCDTQCRKGNLGCVCKPTYILSETNGKCIKPEDCPGGSVCGKNETFVYCSVTCPNNYCPTDDNRFIVVCDPPYPCPNGCSCEAGYRRKSREEYVCILASDCPPVKCTRPNEEWNSCPEPCSSDRCSDRNRVKTPEECFYSGRYCDPQCVCKQGFFRNGTDICVKAEECSIEN